MLEFFTEPDRIILSYKGEQTGSKWIYSELDENSELDEKDSLILSRTFSLSSKELISTQDLEDEDAPVNFAIATREGGYYKF